jgi:RHS repeat-associated protein
MLPAAEERIPALTSGEEIFSLAAGVALAALETYQGARAAQGKKPHQGIFSKKRTIASGAMWAKWSGTHQDRKCSWSKTVVGSALDANGNTLSDPSGKSYSWDFENRLVSAIVPGAGTVAFKYDPFGRRIYKSSPNFTGIFAYDGDDLIETVNSSGGLVARYTRTKNIDEPLAELRQGTPSYYEQDGLGSVTSLSNSAGAVAQTYTYDNYGNVTASTGTLFNPFQYTGREFDPETGLNYNRARYYSPATGRFISEDPLGFGGGNPNVYAYVGNNPTNFLDPFGLTNCVETILGPVCSESGNQNTNYYPQGWQPPPLPSDLQPPPPTPPSPQKPCGCDMVERNRQIDRAVWHWVLEEAWEKVPEEGGEWVLEQYGKKKILKWVPVVKFVWVSYKVYKLYKEVEEINEPYKECWH